MIRRWDSLHPDTLYGDAAARVLCRVIGAEPSGRTLQECLDGKFIEPSRLEAACNLVHGDGRFTLSDGREVGVECKASTQGANVCISDMELEESEAGILAAWVPSAVELCWFATMRQARSAKLWLNVQETWLICRDKMDL